MNQTMPIAQLVRMTVARVLGFFIFIGLLFFLPAGTLAYWQGWMWMITMTLLMLVTLRYLVKNDPALLERRMRMRERRVGQQKLVLVSGLFLTLSFILPGFDIRYGWSQMPVWVAIASNAIVILGYWMVTWVFRVNSYTSRIIEVESGQQVISSGPYAIVRHPMYVGAFLCYGFSPLALGSYWAFIPGVMILPVLIFRILDEEKLLLRDLPGYREYTQRVKYRMLPGIW